MKKIIIVILFCLFYSCYETTLLEKCEAEKGRFINGQHFILGSIMNNEKKINYFKWYSQFKNRVHFQSNCIPIKNLKSFEEKLDDLQDFFDLSR